MTKIRILVVEEDEPLRSALAEALKSHGYSVSTAENGKDALDSYDLLGADIVILNVIMPVNKGIKTVMELKRRQRVPCIIIMTSGGLVAPKVYLKIAKSHRADQLLEKPFQFEKMLQAIQKLEKRSALKVESGAFIGSSRGSDRPHLHGRALSDPLAATAHSRSTR